MWVHTWERAIQHGKGHPTWTHVMWSLNVIFHLTLTDLEKHKFLFENPLSLFQLTQSWQIPPKLGIEKEIRGSKIDGNLNFCWVVDLSIDGLGSESPPCCGYGRKWKGRCKLIGLHVRCFLLTHTLSNKSREFPKRMRTNSYKTSSNYAKSACNSMSSLIAFQRLQGVKDVVRNLCNAVWLTLVVSKTIFLSKVLFDMLAGSRNFLTLLSLSR